jgi:hypothetical protein
MFIRMTSGRDRGEVKEFSFTDAQDLLRTGQAVKVDINEADALTTKTDIEEVKALPFIVPAQTVDAPPVTASKNASKPRRKS